VGGEFWETWPVSWVRPARVLWGGEVGAQVSGCFRVLGAGELHAMVVGCCFGGDVVRDAGAGPVPGELRGLAAWGFNGAVVSAAGPGLVGGALSAVVAEWFGGCGFGEGAMEAGELGPLVERGFSEAMMAAAGAGVCWG